MKTYKWNRLKCNAVIHVKTLGTGCWTHDGFSIPALLQSIEQAIIEEPIKHWRENQKELVEKAINICKNWDIRRAKALFDIFPQLINKKYKGKTPIAEYDEKGDWVIIFED
jgi:hypothetical protein